MTGTVELHAQGRIWLHARYSFIDDRQRILTEIAECYEPPYEIVIPPDVSEEIEALHCSNISAQSLLRAS